METFERIARLTEMFNTTDTIRLIVDGFYQTWNLNDAQTLNFKGSSRADNHISDRLSLYTLRWFLWFVVSSDQPAP